MKLRVDPRVHARLDRPRRGRPDAPADRARCEPAPHPATSTSGARATRSRRRSPGRAALERSDGPTALLLSRQNLPHAAAQRRAARRRSRAAATCSPSRPSGREGRRAVIIATGSEVAARAAGAASSSPAEGIAVRVVSMPSTDVFDRQDDAYRGSVLPPRRAAHRGRGGRDRRLVEVRLRRGRRHRPLRRVGAGAGAVQALRLHGRERRRDGQAPR